MKEQRNEKKKKKQNKTKQKTIDMIESSLLDKKFRDRFILYPT